MTFMNLEAIIKATARVRKPKVDEMISEID